jgi:hypothetical protein
MGFYVHGVWFPNHRAACRYRALVKILDIATVDPLARVRMRERFIAANGGVPDFEWGGA